MSRSDEQRIDDILEAAVEIAAIVERGRQAFMDDPVLQRAVERLLEIIGEAANSLSQATANRYAAVPWNDIARLRVLLAHHYHRVDSEQVWVIAAEDVPALVQSLQKGGV